MDCTLFMFPKAMFSRKMFHLVTLSSLGLGLHKWLSNNVAQKKQKTAHPRTLTLLRVLEVMLEEEILCFDDILSAVTKIPEPGKKLVQSHSQGLHSSCPLLLQGKGASRALDVTTANEDLFLSAQHLKMQLRSRMGDKKV